MPLLCEKHGHVAILTLSRPEKRNAWGDDFNNGLQTHLAQLEQDPDVRCVVLTGDDKGGAFSSGADLKNERTHIIDCTADFLDVMPARRRSHPFVLLSDFAKPLIAAVNGYAIGVGSIVTYCCDLIVASERAEWRLTQVNFGILPAQGATARLAKWIGKGHAMRLALGFPLSAEEAHRIGLAQWLVPHAELMAKTLEIAGQIAALPPLASRLTKESLNFGINLTVPDASHADLYRTMALQLTEDAAETHRAWREKRSPELKGR